MQGCWGDLINWQSCVYTKLQSWPAVFTSVETLLDKKIQK